MGTIAGLQNTTWLCDMNFKTILKNLQATYISTAHSNLYSAVTSRVDVCKLNTVKAGLTIYCTVGGVLQGELELFSAAEHYATTAAAHCAGHL